MKKMVGQRLESELVRNIFPPGFTDYIFCQAILLIYLTYDPFFPHPILPLHGREKLFPSPFRRGLG